MNNMAQRALPAGRLDFAPLRHVVRLMQLEPRRIVLAVLAATTTLLAALALSAVSAWLITRAWQMPPVLALGLAVTGVRALGVTRGVFRYVDRLLAHDVALQGVVNLRERIYTTIATNPAAREKTLRLPRADLVRRLGADADAVGDTIVRAVIPAVVSWVLLLAGVGLIAIQSPPAAGALACGLLLTTFVVPWLALRYTRAAESETVTATSELRERTAATLAGALQLRLAGHTEQSVAAVLGAQTRVDKLHVASAKGLARAAALTPLAQGLSLVGSFVCAAWALHAAAISPMWFTIIILVPLAAFEASSVLPAAAVQLSRAVTAAGRICDVIGMQASETASEWATEQASEQASETASQQPSTGASISNPDLTPTPLLTATDLAVGHDPAAPYLTGFTLHATAGSRHCIIGASGSGKSTLLQTLAGALPPSAGAITGRVRNCEYFAEDAHVFATTLRENLKLTNGHADDAVLTRALAAVGLQAWVESLPNGLDTLLLSDAANISGGQRRRLLLARAILSPADVILLDEPTEHLDAASALLLLAAMLQGDLFRPTQSVIVVTHDHAAAHAAASFSATDLVRLDDYSRAN